MTEGTILGREERLRAWFTQDCDPLLVADDYLHRYFVGLGGAVPSGGA